MGMEAQVLGVPRNQRTALAKGAHVSFPEGYWSVERPNLEAIKLGLGLVSLEAEQIDSLIERVAADDGNYIVREWGVRHKTTAGDGIKTIKRVTGDIDPGVVDLKKKAVVIMRDTLVDYYNDQEGIAAEPTERQDIYTTSQFRPDGLEVIGTFYGLKVSWVNDVTRQKA